MNSETTIKENCSNCEYNRQCFIKKQLGALECQKDKDYITNLEQENKQLKEANNYLQNELYDLKREKKPNYYHSENVNLRRINNNYKSILTELEEWLKAENDCYYYGVRSGKTLLYGKFLGRVETLNKIQELNERYK